MEKVKTNPKLLTDHEGSASELINPLGKAPIVLVCEHASNFIPETLNSLGLDNKAKASHAAWDIGAYELALEISGLLDAPLVASRISRLVYDCNRSPESGIGIPGKSELIEVPGNLNLTTSEINDRVKYVYEPFHELVSDTIKNSPHLTNSKVHSIPAVITIHSFTPVYFGEVRSVELGILHDKDDRLAKPMMQAALNRTKLKAEFNSPYNASDNVMHTVNRHSIKQGLLNVMIEVKNDLLLNTDDIKKVASDLSSIIQEALITLEITEI